MYSARKRSSQATDSASRWLVGSSRSSRSGDESSSRQSATRRRSPPESVVTSRSPSGSRSASIARSSVASSCQASWRSICSCTAACSASSASKSASGSAKAAETALKRSSRSRSGAHAVLDVAANVLGGVELRLLLEQADGRAGRELCDAARGLLASGHDPQQRRLAGAVRPEHADLRPGQEAERDINLRDEGYGFLRVHGYLASRDDAYIPVKLTRQYGLRKGDHVTGLSRPAGRNEKNPAMLEIHTVNGGDPEKARNRPAVRGPDGAVPRREAAPREPSDPTNMTARIIDLISPIGKGQRGIIVSPPKAGKTTIMKTIATSIERNHPEVKLMVLLSTSGPKRSPTCAAPSRVRSSHARSTVRATSTPTSPSWRSRRPSAWSRWARTS